VVVAIGANPNPPAAQDWPGSRPKRRMLTALDAQTGAQRWALNFSDWYGPSAGDSTRLQCIPDSWTNPAIGGDGIVYIGGEDGLSYALQDKNDNGVLEDSHAEITSFNMSFGAQGSPAIAPDLLATTSCRGLHVFLQFEGSYAFN